MSTPLGTLFGDEATPPSTLFGMKYYTLLLRVPCFGRIYSSWYPIRRCGCSFEYPLLRLCCSFEYPLPQPKKRVAPPSTLFCDCVAPSSTLFCDCVAPSSTLFRRSLAGMLYLFPQLFSLSARLFARLTSVTKSISGCSVYLASTSLLYFPRRISVSYCISTLFLCSSSSAFLTSLRLLPPLSD
jgi:hypothetical protein